MSVKGRKEGRKEGGWEGDTGTGRLGEEQKGQIC